MIDPPTASMAVGTIPSARVLEGTGEDVPLSELDAQGRYRRIATGWGEL